MMMIRNTSMVKQAAPTAEKNTAKARLYDLGIWSGMPEIVNIVQSVAQAIREKIQSTIRPIYIYFLLRFSRSHASGVATEKMGMPLRSVTNEHST